MNRNYSRKKIILFYFIIFICILVFSLISTELVFNLLEDKNDIKGDYKNLYHPVLGWLPKPNTWKKVKNKEYEAHYTINSLSMNDFEYVGGSQSSKNILALGDSHTFAVGVSVDETWPNILEREINEKINSDIRVYNAAVTGYNLGQYLLRYRLIQEEIKPELIIIGFSMATDLYDLIPPEKGGFVYGSEKGRKYFTLDDKGELVEVDSLVGIKDLRNKIDETRDVNLYLKSLLYKSATFRRLRRSKAAVWIATNYKPRGKSLMPGLDTALKIDFNEDDYYRWKLAENILIQFSIEAEKNNSKILLVNIPYLAQVYDEIWEKSFGTKPDVYERFIASKRLEEFCNKYRIYYIDTTPLFIDSYRESKKWLHFKLDGHPTIDGQKLIANSIYLYLIKSNIIN